jgi:hypothetical protein
MYILLKEITVTVDGWLCTWMSEINDSNYMSNEREELIRNYLTIIFPWFVCTNHDGTMVYILNLMNTFPHKVLYYVILLIYF